ncbi:cytochrome c biogenesis protein CcsA [Membranihabitans maritimus]|uniref:cytochrome c biogenesis protein CcsA n=1 Tax=Membranihabitans maritimus TaxID=2904244 RepID=UPI001F00164F|nr:cytochrome c biogenesis protein CcsA [Membranihabitans maritimus]
MTENVEYIGELLWPGELGHYLLITAFVAAIVSAISYFAATRNEEDSESWKKLGRYSFYIHGISIIGAIVILFGLMLGRHYEYNYVYDHVSDSLPFKYMFSAFWEDQEGSFLLWAFWQIIVSIVFIKVSSKWESSTMWIMALIQVFLSSMVLGFVVGDGKIGSSPFNLLREENVAPIFSDPNYLSQINGRGLNPLLQNYWMVIHPPTLFLGFALCSVPFAISTGSILMNKFTEWVSVGLKWALWAGGILGIGILMGGAWAYEALSFGGYWAWDPVENTSLVPWLLIVAGIHANVVSKSVNRSYKLGFLMYALTFLMVLYSTFLTRSGLTSESSAHAFTSLGMETQLISFILFFLGLTVFTYFRKRKLIPTQKDEEPFWSREFWMYLGSFVLILSTILITFTTSIPVFNKIIDFVGNLLNQDLSQYHRTTPLDPIAHYNKYQMWIAVLIGLMSGTSQFLRYKEKNFKNRLKKIGKTLGISLLISIPIAYFGLKWVGGQGIGYALLIYAATYGLLSNAAFLFVGFKPNAKKLSSVLSHIGFAIMIWGVMASGLKKHYISTNPFIMRELVADQEMAEKNIMLFDDVPMAMSNYDAIFYQDTLMRNERFYQIKFVEKDQKGNPVDSFELSPSAVYNQDFTEVVSFNPSTDRRLGKDIFTAIKALPRDVMNANEARKLEDSLYYEEYNINIGDTVFLRRHTAVLKDISFNRLHEDYTRDSSDIAIGATLLFEDPENNISHLAIPTLAIKEHKFVAHYPARFNEFKVKARLGDAFVNILYPKDEDLEYHKVVLTKGETIPFSPYTITLNGLNKEISHPEYQSEEGDIAVQAELIIRDRNENITDILEPVFIIRGNSPHYIRDYKPRSGLAANFVHIDPATGKMEFAIGENHWRDKPVSIRIAEDVPRNDFLVLEAIVFPGINLFWLGSILMLSGFFVSLYVRRSNAK